MWIVFIGPPGAGKGTQCARLARSLGVPHLSTGELLRASLHQASPLSEQIAGFINQGQLAPDDLVMRIVQDRLQSPDSRGGCVFDGFPRTIPQARQLDAYLVDRGQRLHLVLHLVVDQQQLVQRMLRRAKLEGRADDTAETIAARFRVFDTQTAPLLDYYREHGIIESIDGGRAPDEVAEEIRRAVSRRSGAASGGASPAC